MNRQLKLKNHLKNKDQVKNNNYSQAEIVTESDLDHQGQNGLKKLWSDPKSQRLLIVWTVLLTGTFGLAANLFRLQILETEKLQQKAKQQQTHSLRPFIPRRAIVDRNNNVLASDRPVYTLYVHPKLFKESKEVIAEKISPILVRPVTVLVQQFNKGISGLIIDKKLTENQANNLKNLRLDGIELEERYARFYPQQQLAADIIGYVDGEHRGQAGLEYSQQQLLERNLRSMRASRLATGSFIPDMIPEGFLQVDDLQLKLTLDSRLQRAARNALSAQVKKFRAKRGAVIVMDSRDGAILSLVSEPTYNPNEYAKSKLELFKNWAVADLYEPGSTFKPVNVAIALEAGVITPNSTFYDGGQITVSGWPIKNAEGGGNGTLNIAQILQYSSNIGMVQMIQKLKPEFYYSWLEKIGLGQTVGIDLPFEAQGRMKNKKQFITSAIEPATTSFGQGISLTPIHLVQLQAALINGGKLVTPHLVKGLYNTQDQVFWQPNLPIPKPVFSPKTSKEVVAMMESVVTEGTGKPAQIPGYRIGGKTGTAQKASASGGYHPNNKITSFVGIIPTNAPRYVVLVVVDEPRDTDGIRVFGSTVAAPVAKTVMEALITIEKIPPSPGLEEQLKQVKKEKEKEKQKEKP